MATASCSPPPHGFCCTVVRTQPGWILLRAAGELDLASAPGFARAVEGRLGRGPAVLIEASAITFIDCAGLRVLLRAGETDPRTALVSPSMRVTRLLDLLELTFPVRTGFPVAGCGPGEGRPPPA